MSEKRKAGRKRKRLKVRFGIDAPQRVAFTDDLSEKGLFISTSAPEKPGTVLMLEVEMPEGDIVKCQGQVRWARKVPVNMLRAATKGGMGVLLGNFTEGQEAYQRLIGQLRY